MKIFILLITFYSSISFGACVPGNIACQNAEIQYFKGQTAPYATPSAGFANLYFDQSVSQGITPRWQDSLATVYPIIGKIVSNRTIYVATTGNDTTGTGLIGAPYFTPQKALDYLSNFLIAPGVEVIISLAAGQYILTSSIVPQHPQGAQITIQGANVATPPVAADFCTPNTVNCSTTLPARGWNNPTAAQREAAANSDLTMLRTKYPTELRFSGNIDGINLKNSSIKLANLLIDSIYLPNTGPAANTKNGITIGKDPVATYVVNSGNISIIGPISVHGFGAAGISIFNSTMNSGSPITVSNGGNHGLMLYTNGGFFSQSNLTTNNVAVNGIYSNLGSSAYIQGNVNCSSSIGKGINSNIHSLLYIAGTCTTNNNGDSGMASYTGSNLTCIGTIISNNNNVSGVVAESNSVISLSNVTSSNNTAYGIYSSSNSSISVGGNANTLNNGDNGLMSNFDSFISIGATLTSNGNVANGAFAQLNSLITIITPGAVQSYSPALNVVGNVEAIIQDL